MRVSFFAIIAFVSFATAAPILKDRGLIGDAVKKFTGALNPKLNIARLKVVKGLADSQRSLNKISKQADATGNADVTSLVADAQTGLTAAKDGVKAIAGSLLTGGTPSKDDQKDVAVGIQDTQTAVAAMEAAITTPDADLSADIAGAVKNVGNLEQGGEDVLAASGLSLADLGLPDDFATADAAAADAAAAAPAAADAAAADAAAA